MKQQTKDTTPSPSIPVKDELLDMPKWDNNKYISWRQWAEACYKSGQLNNIQVLERLVAGIEEMRKARINPFVFDGFKEAKTFLDNAKFNP